MRLKQFAVAVGMLLAAIFAAIAIAVHYLDPRDFAMSLAASVKADTGRELRFGEVGVKLLPRPAIVLSEVRFANAAWGSQPWLAQISRLSADIDAFALFSRRLRIAHITMTDANVLLETNRDGNGNWVMDTAAAGVPAWLKALEIDELTLEALIFTYRNGATGKTTSARIDAARLAAGPAPDPIRLSVRATIDGKKAEVTGTIGALAALIANAPAYPVNLDGKYGAASASVHGAIDQPLAFGGVNLALRAQLPEFADYVAWFGATVPPLGPFRGAAQLTGTPAALVFSGIDVQLGTPQRIGLTARGELTGRRSAGGTYEWQSTGIDLLFEGAQTSDLAVWSGRSLPALGAYRIAARVSGTAAAAKLSAIDATLGGRGVPEIKLRGAIANLKSGRGIDLKLSAVATDWWRPGTAKDAPRLPPFRASARVRDAQQGYRVDDFEARIADSVVNATVQVTQRGSRLHITGKATSPLIDLARLPPAPAAATTRAGAAAAAPAADHWKLADLNLELNVGRLVLPDGRQVQAVSGRLALDDGRLKASALRATLGGANVTLDGGITDPQNLAGLDLKVALQGGELAELMKFFGKPVPPIGPYQGRAQLRGSLDDLVMTEIDATAGRPGQNVRASGQIEDVLKWRGLQLAIAVNVGNSTAAGLLFGADLPHLPALRATARVTGQQDGYALDDLKLALGRTSVQGRVVFAPGEPRTRLTANLSGPLVDLSEFPSARTKPGVASPLLAADVEADIRFDRVVLPDRRALGPVSGKARLTAGAVELNQFSIAVDGASATVDGRINDPLTPAGLDLTVNARVTRGTGLSAFTGIRLQNMPAVTASAKVSDVPNGYALAGLKLAHAATTITGDVAVTRGAKRYKVSAKASSSLLDHSAVMRPAAAGNAAKPVAAGTRVIPDVPLPLDVLLAIDADLDLRFDAVKLGDGPPLGPLLARVTIADGLLTAEPVQLGGKPGQTLSVAGTVDAGQSAWALRVEGVSIDFGALLARFGRPNVVTGGSTDFDLQFRGQGKSLAAILGSLNGNAQLKVGPYRIHNFAVPLEGGIIIHMFGLANPFFKADPNTEVKCFTARVPIKNGILTSERRVATETAKYNAALSGTLNLRTEGLDLTVMPVVRGEVTTVVRVRGTLAAPVTDVDAVGAVVKSAASLGAAVATFGGSLLVDTLIKKTAADTSPCATALAQ